MQPHVKMSSFVNIVLQRVAMTETFLHVFTDTDVRVENSTADAPPLHTSLTSGWYHFDK